MMSPMLTGRSTWGSRCLPGMAWFYRPVKEKSGKVEDENSAFGIMIVSHQLH